MRESMRRKDLCRIDIEHSTLAMQTKYQHSMSFEEKNEKKERKKCGNNVKQTSICYIRLQHIVWTENVRKEGNENQNETNRQRRSRKKKRLP